MSREKTNELVLKLLPLYESQEVGDKIKTLLDYYDIKTLTPFRELVTLYDQVEDEL